MRPLLAQVKLKNITGFPEDDFINTFAVAAADTFVGNAVDLGQITIPIAQIYTSTAGTHKVGELLSKAISRSAAVCKIDLYDLTGHLDGSPHGSPFASDSFTMPAALANDGLPSEVALVCTLRASGWLQEPVETPDGADAGTAVDRPRSRWSGRVYFGPFNTARVDADTTRPQPLLCTTIRDSIVAQQAVLMTTGHSLAVWSRQGATMRKLQGAGLLPAAVQVDNAWDTQRRRGLAPTLRYSTTLT